MSRRDHRRAECLLVGVAQQGYAVYDSQVGLQYLLSRPEVDPARIGMTGASGGGFDTWMNAALDDRIKVAVPVVGTCDLYEQAMKRLPIDWDPNDHCHYIPGLFRYANNHELLAMAAPKPVMIVSATNDGSFPIRGVREIVEYGRRLYRSYGMPERFAYSEDSTEAHGFQVRKREAVYGFFLRWLMQKGDGAPVAEPATQTLPFDSLELRSFPAGQNQAAGPAMVAAVERLASGLPPPRPRQRLEDALGSWPTAPAWTAQLSPGRLQRLVVPSEPDLEIPAFLLRPAGNIQGLLIAVDDRGKEAALSDSAVREASEAGWAVLGVDPRAMGESKTSKNTWLFAISLFEGENLVWRQAWDIFRTIEGVASAPEFRSARLALYASGQNASLAATYLLGHAGETRIPRLSWFVLRDAFLTYHDFVDRPKSEPLSFELRKTDDEARKPLDREIPGSYIPFDCLSFFDLPQLLAAPGIPGMLVNPIDGDWSSMTSERARKLLSGKLQVASGPAAEDAARRFVGEAAGGRGR
jgi:dienelactone hydrolase